MRFRPLVVTEIFTNCRSRTWSGKKLSQSSSVAANDEVPVTAIHSESRSHPVGGNVVVFLMCLPRFDPMDCRYAVPTKGKLRD